MVGFQRFEAVDIGFKGLVYSNTIIWLPATLETAVPKDICAYRRPVIHIYTTGGRIIVDDNSMEVDRAANLLAS
jgi:hypothetical protein